MGRVVEAHNQRMGFFIAAESRVSVVFHLIFWTQTSVFAETWTHLIVGYRV